MSAEIINLHEHRDSVIDAKWAAYASAQQRAQKTLRIEDGKAAGRAWREWLNLWMTEEQRQWTGGADGR